jgi:HAMP domain-containing protein
MEDNYLWDRSGEPDPEVQELEEILGTLRYQPRPQEIPRHIQVGRRRSFFPAMAIAAVIALFAVLLGLWFGFNRRQAPLSEARNDSQVDQPANKTTTPLPSNDQAEKAAVVNRPKQTRIQEHREAPRNLLARNQRRATRTVIRQPELTPEELAEKEQVLVALRLVSYKLNLAQRKTQGLPQLNPIRNQHKIG